MIPDFIRIHESIQFNLWKHHLNYIKGQIKNLSKLGETSLDEIKLELLKIGTSQMDLYLGDLSPKNISDQILDILRNLGIDNNSLYSEWISSGRKYYRSILLNDSSKWILRLGNDEIKYIHVHPARNSDLCIRVKAATLKTAILVSFFSQLKNTVKEDLSAINIIRKKFLVEPPIKSLPSAGSLINLLKLMN